MRSAAAFISTAEITIQITMQTIINTMHSHVLPRNSELSASIPMTQPFVPSIGVNTAYLATPPSLNVPERVCPCERLIAACSSSARFAAEGSLTAASAAL